MATMSATRFDYSRSPTWARDHPQPSGSFPPPASSSSSRYPSTSTPRTRPGHSFFPAEGSAVRDNSAYSRPPPREAQYRPAHQSVEYDGSSSFLPDVRVTEPPRMVETHSGYAGSIGTIPDEDASVYSQRMSTSTAQQYHSSVFQGQSGRDSMNSVATPNGSTHFNQLFPGEVPSSTSIHHLSSMSMSSILSRESWQTGTGPEKEPVRPESNVDPFSYMQYESSRGHVPKVVVSSPSDQSHRSSSNQHSPAHFSPRGSVNSVNGGQPSMLRLNGQGRLAEIGEDEVVIPHPITPPPFQPPQGRVPSAPSQVPRNFSRPSRAVLPPSSPPDNNDRSPLSSNSPSSALNTPRRPPIPDSQDAKLEVFERNQQRRMQNGNGIGLMSSPTPSTTTSSNLATSSSSRPVTPQDGVRLGAISPSRHPLPASPTPSSSHLYDQDAHSPNTMPSRPPRSPNPVQGPGLVVLPAHLPNLRDRQVSSESLYSVYSYYNLDGSKPPSPSSPDMNTGLSPGTAFSSQKSISPTSTLAASPNGHPSPPSKHSKSPPVQGIANELQTNPQTADEFLALGIAHHEADRLEESASCFEKAARLESGGGLDSNDLPFGNLGKGGEIGSAVGMLMWGLSLRHGWGVPKDEAQAFKWLKAAAEHAVVDLQKGAAKSGKEIIRKELVLAVYEVGQSFFHGWGVKKDKVMAVNYFQTAAKLGDPDAQQDLAFCLANGKGCKKDRKKAAKWYRAAADQGASTVGLAWIYKPKYLD